MFKSNVNANDARGGRTVNVKTFDKQKIAETFNTIEQKKVKFTRTLSDFQFKDPLQNLKTPFDKTRGSSSNVGLTINNKKMRLIIKKKEL
jgi:hypothetical protein